jgi:hypothetical protein
MSLAVLRQPEFAPLPLTHEARKTLNNLAIIAEMGAFDGETRHELFLLYLNAFRDVLEAVAVDPHWITDIPDGDYESELWHMANRVREVLRTVPVWG